MNPSQHHRLVRQIFEQACDLPPSERDAVLNSKCCNDEQLRFDVESMLRLDGAEHDLLEAVESNEGPNLFAAAIAADSLERNELPERIDGYRILGKVGEGGMGIILEAEQESPRRRVAIKLLRPNTLGLGMIKRFQNEAHVLGQLQHPGIAQIHEAGVAQLALGRQPYFAMEFIEGERLDLYVKSHGLATRQRMELLARVCDAVQHAHQKGIIHRDLKPSNVLVVNHSQSVATTPTRTSSTGSMIDLIGQPKVLDFGIARVTDANLQTVTIQTEVGQLVGTLAYMSPEQIAGDSASLDTRCDVYAIGVMLYEILAARRPYDLNGKSVTEAARTIQETQPPALGTIDKSLRGDVETIVSKAMEKDRARRYDSVAELAADIRRFLSHQPIEARPASAIYHLQRFARRNKGLVAGMTMAFAMLVVTLIVTGYSLMRARASNQSLRKVVEYQSAMLDNVDVSEMGRQMIADLRSEVRSKLDTDDDILAGQLKTFEQVLSLANATTIASHSLDNSLMSPAVAALDTQFADQPDLRVELRKSWAEIYDKIGLAEKALVQSLKILKTHQTRLGELDPTTLATRHRICDLLLKLGRYEEAEVEARKLLDLQRKTLGAEHLDTLATQRLLGAALTYLTRPDEAEPLLTGALATLQRTVGPQHEATLRAQKRLAEHYRQQREFKKAREALAVVFAEREARLGPEHRLTLETLGEIAGLHFMENELEQAIESFRRIAKSHQSKLGADHPDTLTNRHGLGLALTEHGDYREAEQVLIDTLERRRRVLGPDHPQTVLSVGAVARLMVRTQRWSEAEQYQREALDIALRTLGRDNGTTLNARFDLALILHKGSRFELADELCRASLAEFRRVLGPEHYRTLSCQQYLGKILMTVGNLEEASELFEKMLPACREKYADTAMLPGTLGQASSTLIGLERGAEAAELIRELITWCEEHKLPPTVIAKAHVWLARAHFADNRFEDADAELVRALELYGKGADKYPMVPVANLLRHAIAAQAGDSDRLPDAIKEYQRFAARQLKPEDRGTLVPELRRILLALDVPEESLDAATEIRPIFVAPRGSK